MSFGGKLPKTIDEPKPQGGTNERGGTAVAPRERESPTVLHHLWPITNAKHALGAYRRVAPSQASTSTNHFAPKSNSRLVHIKAA